MNTERRTIAPSDAARSASGASIFRPRRRSGVFWTGALAATISLAGCAGLPGSASQAPGAPPAVPQPGSSQAAVAQNPAAPFSASVALVGSSPVRLGEAVSFILSTNTAGYGHLYLLNASGKVVALTENLPVAPGAHTLFPPPDGRMTIRPSPPVGIERVLFLVTLQPFHQFAGAGAAGVPRTLAVQAEAFIANLNAATARLPGNGWALAETRIEVVAGGS